MVETLEFDRVDRIADILFGVAHARGLINYGPLARRVQTRPDFIGRQLYTVSERAFERGEPMWTVLVVAAGERMPKSGFYEMARRLRPEYAPLGEDEIFERERALCYQAAN